MYNYYEAVQEDVKEAIVRGGEKNMNYTITDGTKAGAKEIYFEKKPNTEILAALKTMRFHWNNNKKCWFGFATEETIKQAVDGQQTELTEEAFDKEFNIVTSEGYLGATETTGSKSGHLYGSELTKAIRADFKKWNIKGVTLSKQTYSGGQSITVTITAFDGDYISLSEYKKQYFYDDGQPNYSKALEMGAPWIYYYTTDQTAEDYGSRAVDSIHYEKFFALDDETIKKNIFLSAIEYQYKMELKGNINKYHIDGYKAFTEQFLTRFNKIKKIVDSYNHDGSNSMVDYFDRNFYEDYKIKTAWTVFLGGSIPPTSNQTKKEGGTMIFIILLAFVFYFCLGVSALIERIIKVLKGKEKEIWTYQKELANVLTAYTKLE